MEFAIQDKFGNYISEGETDNAYQVRQLIASYLTSSYQLVDPHMLKTQSVLIWCSAEIPPLLLPCPQIVNDSCPPKPTLTYTGTGERLADLCKLYQLNPIRTRRVLRRLFGTQNKKYFFTRQSFEQLLPRLQTICA